MKFRDLQVGWSFDFINDAGGTTFFLRCEKTGTRTYRDESGTNYKVGSINCVVYHVHVYGLASRCSQWEKGPAPYTCDDINCPVHGGRNRTWMK